MYELATEYNPKDERVTALGTIHITQRIGSLLDTGDINSVTEKLKQAIR